MSNSQKFKPTYILIALNIAFYAYTSFVGGDFLNTSGQMILDYSQINFFIIYEAQYYRLLSSLFVHANIAHLAGNMLFLLIFGLRSEEMFSLPEYLLIYFMGGLTGNVLSLLLLPFDVPSVGASGAIFAMFGAATVYARRSFSQSIIGALIYAFFLLFLSSGPGVNNYAHLGGLITGLLIGYALAARRKPETQYAINYSYSIAY
ncbi:MAG: rhomboid family intramembrane serine protease [Candidatus Bathyarchaeota archaeon]|nr:rhomboid family intramembrane serine protease [Candidatus Bathyarchaeota archaeon]